MCKNYIIQMIEKCISWKFHEKYNRITWILTIHSKSVINVYQTVSTTTEYNARTVSHQNSVKHSQNSY